MKYISISLEEFNTIRNRETDKKFLYPYLKVLYNFYVEENNSQEAVYIVEDDNNKEVITPAEVSLRTKLFDFGIQFRSSLNNIETIGIQEIFSREFILIIPKVDSAQYAASMITSLANKYLPKNAVPTWYADLNEYTSYQDSQIVTSALQEKYPGIQGIIHFENLLSDYHKSRDINSIIEEQDNIYYKSTGKHIIPLNISKLVDSFTDVFISSNLNTFNLFNKCIQIVLDNLKEDTLVIYNGLNYDTYIKFACQLTYFHNVNCYIPEMYYKDYFGILSTMFINNNGLLENKIKYLINFPTYGFMNTSYSLTYVGTLNRYVYGKLRVCSIGQDIEDPLINSNGMMVLDKVNLATLKIIPLLDLFDLSSNDLNECKLYEASLRKIYTLAEDILGIPEGIMLDVTNTFFYSIDNTIMLAYMEKLDFSTDSILVCDALISGNKVKPASTLGHITVDTLNKVIPLDILAENSYAKKVMMAIEPRFAPVSFQQKLGIDKPKQIKEIKALREYSPVGLLLYYFSINKGRTAMSPLPKDYFHEIGLYSAYCTRYRQGASNILLQHLNRKALRKDSNFISVYGGYHPLISPTLVITESMQK